MMAVSGRKRPMSLAEEQVRRGLSQLTVRAQPSAPVPGPHAASHENGGIDEIDVVGLSGLLADAQTPAAHALATTGPHNAPLPLVDLEVAVQGELIARGAADWEALAVGAAGEALLSGGAGANVSWGTPATVAHALATTGPHNAPLPLIDLEVGVQGEVIHRGAVDWEALAVGNANDLLTSGGAGADVSWVAPGAPAVHGAAQHTDVTRELFLPAFNDSHANAVLGDHGTYYSAVELPDNQGTGIYFVFKVPDDFVSFTSLEFVWVCSAAAGNMHWRVLANWAASGEASNTHTELPALGNTATGGVNFINVQEAANANALAGLALGDYVGLNVYRGGNIADDTLGQTVDGLGVLFTYTASQ